MLIIAKEHSRILYLKFLVDGWAESKKHISSRILFKRYLIFYSQLSQTF